MGGALIGMRTIIGGLVGGLALFLVGFVFWGTPLSGIAFSSVDDAANARLQVALAQDLTQAGTGTYHVPWPATPQGTVLHGRGPIATIHFNTDGFAAFDSASLVSGLLLALITSVLIALALGFADARSFGRRSRLVVLFALAATAYVDLGQPIFNHYGWRYFVFTFVADFAGLAVAGLVIARWFLDDRTIVAEPAATRH